MADSPAPPLVLDGWFVLHQFFRQVPGGARGSMEGDNDPSPDLRSAADLLSDWEDLGDDGWSGVYRIVGGGADYLIMHFRRTLEGLADAEKVVARHPGLRWMEPTDDYLSVVELGLYALTQTLRARATDEGVTPGSDEWNTMVDEAMDAERAKRYVQARLAPRQPEEMPYVCFYPMDKRRNVGQNWYTLPLEDRAAMMANHGRTGRGYAGRISQVISGSVGFDDWEWAVTLFATDPLDFKALVTEMRYDEVSSVYAEFGRFWTGYRIPGGELAEEWSS